MENLDTPDCSSVLYPEEFAGPLAFLRLLLLLSERGLLSRIPSWSAIPLGDSDAVQPGAKNLSLSHLKQITSPAVIRKSVSMSLKRVKELREVRGRREVEAVGLHLWFRTVGGHRSVLGKYQGLDGVQIPVLGRGEEGTRPLPGERGRSVD